MQFNQKMMRNLAVIAVIMSVMIMSIYGQSKKYECCTEVSNETYFKSPITGFKLLNKNPPCVKAVLLSTTEGQRCMNSRLIWVRQKVQELRKIHNEKRATKMSKTV